MALAGEQVHWAYSPTNRNLPNLLRNTLLSWSVLLHHRPDLILSTGAGVAVPFLILGKLLGHRTVFVESITRIETLSLSAGVDLDVDQSRTGVSYVGPAFHGDLGLSSRRRHFERRAIVGAAVGGYGDTVGNNGVYFTSRFEAMAGPPGLAFGGDLGAALRFGQPDGFVTDVGPFANLGLTPVYPWVRASVIWYLPLPRDRFVVVPRAQDPLVFEPEPPPDEVVVDRDGGAFPGIPAVHWSQIEPSLGDAPVTGPEFDAYPPGTYACNVRVAIDEAGLPEKIRVEHCPAAGRAAAETAVRAWRWFARPGGGVVQSVFPAPFFVDRSDAEPIRFTSVRPLVDGQPTDLPPRTRVDVWVRARVDPDFGVNRPTRRCEVDIDLAADGTVAAKRWVSGDVEVRTLVEEALESWGFFPVIVAGEPTPARVRVTLCES
jgi:hypothetical protein